MAMVGKSLQCHCNDGSQNSWMDNSERASFQEQIKKLLDELDGTHQQLANQRAQYYRLENEYETERRLRMKLVRLKFFSSQTLSYSSYNSKMNVNH